MKLTAKQVKMYHSDEDWVKYVYNDGILSGMINEYIDITSLLEDIVDEWEWPGKMFDDFGSDRAVQMVNVICVRIEDQFGIDPHKSHQYQFFNFMRYCFSKIKEIAIKSGKI